MNARIIEAVMALSLGLIGSNVMQAKDAKHTNIILFLIDDLGWKDLVCYGSPFYETPRRMRPMSPGNGWPIWSGSCINLSFPSAVWTIRLSR